MAVTLGELNISNIDSAADFVSLASSYRRIRNDSLKICEPLETEDFGIQTMPDVSPPKWHLAHTSWFFETFLLKPFLPGYREFNQKFAYLFNSYYEQAGTFHPRPQRGLLSRPTLAEVMAYRIHVDDAMLTMIDQAPDQYRADIISRTETGLNHEQQHQELLLTDIKHILGTNPLRPMYKPCDYPSADNAKLEWQPFEAGLVKVGATESGFSYDNELPRHDVWLQSFQIASVLVTNRDYIEFIEDGGYQRPELWLSEGWSTIKNGQLSCPLYWQKNDNEWWHYTLSGMQPVDLSAPVCHVNYYEANAYADWAGARLPSEAEWEFASSSLVIDGNFRDRGYLQPLCLHEGDSSMQFFGDVWEWTRSAYGPYNGYAKAAGALGEYNGKFMCGQYVLRGGSCVTPMEHMRHSYRNFFYPADQWQFSGIRLAKDVT